MVRIGYEVAVAKAICGMVNAKTPAQGPAGLDLNRGLLSPRSWRNNPQMTALRRFLRPIRLGAAIALVCALCLPLSQCSQSGNDSPPPSKQMLLTLLFPQSNNQVTVKYAASMLLGSAWRDLGTLFGFAGRAVPPSDTWWAGRDSWQYWCTFLAFTWPLLSVLAAGSLAESRFSWIYHLLELPLCCGTAFMFLAITYFDTWLYGSYIVVISIGFFTCTSLAFLGYSLWRVCRKCWDKIRGSGDNHQAIPGPAPTG